MSITPFCLLMDIDKRREETLYLILYKEGI